MTILAIDIFCDSRNPATSDTQVIFWTLGLHLFVCTVYTYVRELVFCKCNVRVTVYVCVYECVYVCVCMSVCVCVCVCAHVCVHVAVCVCLSLKFVF